MIETPHYHLVPKDLVANVRFREKMVTLGSKDRSAAHDLWMMCARDPLFYFNTFCWCPNPKDYPDQPVRPFITHEQQDEALIETIERFGLEPICCPKSRDMGATQLFTAAFEWAWHFLDNQSFLMASRKQDLVDVKKSKRTLFYRIDFCHLYQPNWLLPGLRKLGDDDPHRKTNLLGNPDNGSVIEGEATVENLGAGDKRTAILLDERALMGQNRAISIAVSEATNCVISSSTPRGTGGSGGEFYRLFKNPAVHNIILHWSRHPDKSRGMYTSRRAKGSGACDELVIIDKEYKFPADYPFILDGDRLLTVGYDYRLDGERVKVRSPWYDMREEMSGNEAETAQERDIDFLSSGAPYFDAIVLDDYKRKHCRLPLHEMVLEYGEFADAPHVKMGRGGLLLWCNLITRPKNELVPAQIWGACPPEGDYVVSCDISTGNRASNSVASVTNRLTGQKVAQFAVNDMSQEKFAVYVVALCRWFWGAQLIWETNGPGQGFGNTVVDSLLYRRLWYPYTDAESPRKHKRKKTPGWHSDTRSKERLLSAYKTAMLTDRFINPSSTAVDECSEYVYQTDRTIEHSQARVDDDPASSGENHGDYVIADALGALAIAPHQTQRITSSDKSPKGQAVPGTLAHRMQLNDESRETHRGSFWKSA